MLKSRVPILGQEVGRIHYQGKILDLESRKVKESFAAQVAGWLEETDDRPARHEAVTSRLHEIVRGTEWQSISRSPGEIHVGITFVLFLWLHGCYEGFPL